MLEVSTFLLYSILFYSILFYSILFYSILRVVETGGEGRGEIQYHKNNEITSMSIVSKTESTSKVDSVFV